MVILIYLQNVNRETLQKYVQINKHSKNHAQTCAPQNASRFFGRRKLKLTASNFIPLYPPINSYALLFKFT